MFISIIINLQLILFINFFILISFYAKIMEILFTVYTLYISFSSINSKHKEQVSKFNKKFSSI